MDAAETAQTLTELSRAKAQIAELEARVAAHADDLHVGQDVAASSAANWLAHQTKQTRAETNRTVRLGHDLEAHQLTRDALAAGRVCVDQARVIVQAVDRIPADVRPRAEQHLLAEAQHHDAKALRLLGKRLYEVIDPNAADADEAALLEREEAAAMKACRLTLRDDGHGTTHLRGQIPTFHGAALRKMLTAITAPKHQRAVSGAGAEQLRGPEAMGQAFCSLIERYPVTQLPKLGGLNATLVVTITEDSLMGRAGQAGLLDTGDRISPGQARRLLCGAGVIPVVLGGDSVPIDVGRERRFHPKYQRIAITVRDQGCRAEGCDRRLGLHTHHETRWADGGKTTVDQGISLCPWHHARIHDSAYEARTQPTGKVSFHRRP
ncbi:MULTISPECIES: HNH endonuclease signature motif containing protein [Nocardioides]|nr:MULTISPECIES: HNH endonuclease signature motif containing protein [unclassified Nocardioides]